jgi:hypothetical protein
MSEIANPKGDPVLLGIEIGGTKTQAVLSDLQAKRITQARFTVRPEEGGEGIRHDLAKRNRRWRERFHFAGVGVGFGGPVKWRTSSICCSVHVKGLVGLPARRWLEEITGAPLSVENDTNTAALAEARFGAATKYNPVFYTNSGHRRRRRPHCGPGDLSWCRAWRGRVRTSSARCHWRDRGRPLLWARRRCPSPRARRSHPGALLLTSRLPIPAARRGI